MAITIGSGANFIDRTGQRFGRWLVLERTSQVKNVRWVCKCDCGTVRDIRASDLQSGKTNSCGCIQVDRKGKTIVGLNKREYHSWSGMKQRCYYAKHIEFHRYGGRGITVCAEWLTDFSAFLRDMGSCPAGHSIERNDNEKPYCKENCKWATRIEQMSNTSKNVIVEHEGQSMTLKQLSQKLGLNYFRLHSQYRRKGLPLNEAIAVVSLPGINRPYRWKPVATPS